jgi:hypothetical protein
MAKPPRLVQRRLTGRPAHASDSGDFIDRKIADAVVLDFSSDDSQHRALPFSIMVPDSIGRRARAAESPAPNARGLAIG